MLHLALNRSKTKLIYDLLLDPLGCVIPNNKEQVYSQRNLRKFSPTLMIITHRKPEFCMQFKLKSKQVSSLSDRTHRSYITQWNRQEETSLLLYPQPLQKLPFNIPEGLFLSSSSPNAS